MVAETLPPKRADAPVPHLSAGRYYTPQRYVIGWPSLDLVKIGSTSNKARVRRFMRTDGAELIDLAYYAAMADDLRAESWLHSHALVQWSAAFREQR